MQILKGYFLGKQRKKFQMSSAKIFTQYAMHKTLTIFSTTEFLQ